MCTIYHEGDHKCLKAYPYIFGGRYTSNKKGEVVLEHAEQFISERIVPRISSTVDQAQRLYYLEKEYVQETISSSVRCARSTLIASMVATVFGIIFLGLLAVGLILLIADAFNTSTTGSVFIVAGLTLLLAGGAGYFTYHFGKKMAAIFNDFFKHWEK